MMLVGLLIVTPPCFLGACSDGSSGSSECCSHSAPANDPGRCTSYAYACLCHLVGAVSSVTEGTIAGVHQEVDDPCRYPIATFDTVHGDATTAPTDGFVCGSLEEGDRVLFVVARSGVAPDSFRDSYLLEVKSDGNVALSCGKQAPALTKEDAIAALLAQTAQSPGSKECTGYLVALDPAWGLPQCN